MKKLFALSIDKYEPAIYGEYFTADHLDLVDSIEEEELDDWIEENNADYDVSLIRDLRSVDSIKSHSHGQIYEHESRTIIIAKSHTKALKILTDLYLNIKK